VPDLMTKIDPNRRQAKIAAAVILVAMVGWMFLGWMGGQMNWPVRYAFLIDFATLAALVWALVVLFLVWRDDRKKRDT